MRSKIEHIIENVAKLRYIGIDFELEKSVLILDSDNYAILNKLFNAVDINKTFKVREIPLESTTTQFEIKYKYKLTLI